MKKSMKLAGIALISTLLLGACGKSQDDTTTKETKSKTEQVTKMKNAGPKDSKNGKSRKIKDDVELKKTQASTNQTNKISQEQPSTNVTDTYSLTEVPIPEELIGTWSGNAGNTSSVEFTVMADGTINSIVEVERGTEYGSVEETTAKITKLIQVAPDMYVIDGFTGDASALLPGIVGIGGVGKTKSGFILNDGSYTPILWGTAIDEEFDYSKGQPFSVTYQKGELSTSEKEAREQTAANSKF